MPHVSETYEARVQTSGERRRLAQIRKSFDAGVKQKNDGADVPIAFFDAAVAYIKASMDRLHAQDQRIHDFLKPHVSDDDEHADVLSNLNMRLAKSRDALDELVASMATYKETGDTGWTDFKAAVDTFMDVYMKILLSGHHSTMTLQEEVFDEDTWDRVAGATPESIALEKQLYASVQNLAPADADPASFVGARPAPGAGPPGQKASPT